jgi:hypothetical protein
MTGESPRCPACGATNAAGAAQCAVCGADLKASGGSRPRPHATPAPAATRDPEVSAVPRYARTGGLVGVARDVAARTEQTRFSDGKELEQVVTFRVDRFDDDGRPLPSIPGEMRALRLRGFVNDGDWVDVGDRWREGQLLQPKRVRNLTTGASLEGSGSARPYMRVLAFIVFLIVVVIIFAAAAQGIH